MSASESEVVSTEILCVGMLCADVIARPVNFAKLDEDTVKVDRIEVKNGGDCMNVAVVLGALGCDVALCGKVGDDLFGEHLMKILAAHGVDTRAVTVVKGGGTGSCIVLIDGRGQRMFLYDSAANRTLTERDISPELLAECGHMHISGVFQMPGLDGGGCASLLKRAKAAGKTTSMDVTWDSEGRWLKLLAPSLPYLDLFMPSEAEASMITGRKDPEQMADFLLSRGVGAVVIKLGERGCYVRNPAEAFNCPAFQVDAVDTTGAGDSFVAGFLSQYTKGRSLRECAVYSSAVAAFCVQRVGATAGAPNSAQVERFIAERKRR